MNSSASEQEDAIILRTKLHRPPMPPDFVPRPRLADILEAGRTLPLTLVSAPAGYGKSVLVSSWLQGSEWPSAWLSLDTDDGDIRQFLRYLVAAVRTVRADACEQSWNLVAAPELPPTATIATILANDLDDIEHPFLLALDDYHRIDATSPAHDLLAQLLTHPPLRLHLVISTRRDPPLPLVMLRARGQLNDIRMQDLLFESKEARVLLQKAAAFTPNDEAIANLDKEIEGWAVGLRLVSLTAQRAADPNAYLIGLGGGFQQTQAYLLDEVLANQLPGMRDWMLKSSVLARFCASSCDAVCGNDDATDQPGFNGVRFIQALCGNNLFVISLDPDGKWFRYHHLFQKMLLGALKKQLAPDEIHGLYKVASGWHERHGLIEEAIEYALETDDTLAAADVVGRHWRTEMDQDRWYNLNDWLKLLPPGAVQQRPQILLAGIWQAIAQQKYERLPSLVEQLESRLQGEKVDVETKRDRNFFHALIEYFQGRSKASIDFFDKAIGSATTNQGVISGGMELFHALAQCMHGEQALAIDLLRERIRKAPQSAIYRSQLIFGLVISHLVSGELAEGGQQAKNLMLLTRKHKIANSGAWSHYFLGLDILQRGYLNDAIPHFTAATEQRHVLEPQAAIEAFAGLALTQALLGQKQALDNTLDRLASFAGEHDEPEYVLLADSCLARLRLLRGELDQAVQWALAIPSEGTPGQLLFWLEVPALTRARILLASGSEANLQTAADELQTLRQQCENWHFVGQRIEAGALESLVLEKLGRNEGALDMLEQTLAVASAGSWIRPFIEPGRDMERLLRRLAEQRGPSVHLQVTLEAFQAGRQAAAAVGPDIAKAEMVSTREPLTRRERDILELLAQRLQNKEIAAALFVSPETVKSHVRNLYQKLEVTNRRDAATKAMEILAAMEKQTGTTGRPRRET
jgi:LuxR family maltose regulon positive regulatory protein